MLCTCGHCQRLFLPDFQPCDFESFCPACASGYKQLQLECASLPSAKAVMVSALRRTQAIKRRLVLEPPSTFAGLLSWLLAHPHVLITGPSDVWVEPRPAAFMSYDQETLYFRGWNSLTALRAPLADPGLVFDSSGFTIHGPTCQIRVEYQP